MNRTFISLAHSVMKKLNIGHSLEYEKYIRGHTNEETTNIYIDVPQERVDFLTKQLFRRGSFGYIPDLFAKLLYGKENSFETRTDQIMEIKRAIGGPKDLENIAGFMNLIEQETKLVEDILSDMDEQELWDTYHKIETNQMSGKEEFFQCLVSQTGCVYPGKRCSECLLSIPNFYALSTISSRILSLIVEFNNEFKDETLPAEKTRLANTLHMNLRHFQSAMEKFGKDEVYKFLNIESEVFKKALQSLPDNKDYLTI
ncbi:hypothetical protein BATDEDRAFT_29036 [Batrachochytrium dendrobatidis JAM81]|uniref:Uncharacterized protein n=1 Tax=Batrachochytrium dendrobatidis (strain JAM81 / FGSC 10211) TaxID=684364 RepID=F4PG10_BATDJ|nr:uncharacterized protein BATDEDRAFT_29036 [Batrachochytrium dendrobatidis JAM81]EGF75831.1 hypothetical protein BATDEDRAFT_29036 [Batrachochytrium dendrobatidis JAM81]|eukprot:XP_006683543.1 hypothetical protein BATDEDRAFT_29036 [Batrachochytrium dendrobatidis JAM81]